MTFPILYGPQITTHGLRWDLGHLISRIDKYISMNPSYKARINDPYYSELVEKADKLEVKIKKFDKTFSNL